MKKRRMAKSVRKFIRREKSRIRREVLDVKNQEEQIDKIYKDLNYDNKRNLQPSGSNGN